MNVKTQKFLVLGASKSGCACVEYILANGGVCFVYEELKSEKIQNSLLYLKELGAIVINQEDIDKILEQTDVVILSPGVPINHAVAVKAKAKGVRITGELEFGFAQFQPLTIAVTGTNGKTTTVTLIDAILKQESAQSILVGNVGMPITKKLLEINKNNVMVTEVSSFQLESINSFCPHIACVINISPDHLERHYTMENYVFLKKRIFKNQRESEYTVLNFDDNTVRSFSTETKAKVIWVSVKEKVDGAYRENGKLFFKEEYIIDQTELNLYGEHNVYNVLFAIACAKLLGVKTSSIKTALENFKGIKHRMELVAEINGVKFYNDSKATNTASTIEALKTVRDRVVLIMGGSEKGEDYKQLFETIKMLDVKQVVLTGASRYKMLSAAGSVNFNDITVTSDFDFAVNIAKMIASSGECVLLSPACASFDSFSNYEERGERFINLVGEAIE